MIVEAGSKLITRMRLRSKSVCIPRSGIKHFEEINHFSENDERSSDGEDSDDTLIFDPNKINKSEIGIFN